MKTQKTIMFGLLAVIAIIMGGIGFALAQSEAIDPATCEGNGFLGLLKGSGFWSQLTEEQRTQLAEQTQEMLQAGASREEIRAMKAVLLQEWGIDAPIWSGPHEGSQGGHGQMLRDGSGMGGHYGGRGSVNRDGKGGNGYKGVCPN